MTGGGGFLNGHPIARAYRDRPGRHVHEPARRQPRATRWSGWPRSGSTPRWADAPAARRRHRRHDLARVGHRAHPACLAGRRGRARRADAAAAGRRPRPADVGRAGSHPRALALVDALARADGVIFASPAYHRHRRQARQEHARPRRGPALADPPYLEGRAVGCIAVAGAAAGGRRHALRPAGRGARAARLGRRRSALLSTPRTASSAPTARSTRGQVLCRLDLLAEQVDGFAEAQAAVATADAAVDGDRVGDAPRSPRRSRRRPSASSRSPRRRPRRRPGCSVRPSPSARIVPPSARSQPSTAARPFGWSRRVLTKRRVAVSAGPCG